MCVLAAHLLRGIDDTCVVAELQRSDHSCPDGQHQRKRQLLLREQYKRVQRVIFSNTMERSGSQSLLLQKQNNNDIKFWLKLLCMRLSARL